MKTKSKCIGCEAVKLVNGLGLCKRCNTHAHDFISMEEMIRIKLEREAILSATKAAKKAKKDEAAAKEEEAKEGEEEGEEEGEKAEEAGETDKTKDKDKKKS